MKQEQDCEGAARICLLKSLLLAVLYTHRRGVGAFFLLWGKGLSSQNYKNRQPCKLVRILKKVHLPIVVDFALAGVSH